MKIKPFKLERYFARYEFNVKYFLSSSDCEGLKQDYVLSLADEETHQLWDNLVLGYTESKGHPLLRVEVAKLYQKVTPDDVLIAAPEEGIFLVLNSILDKSDHVICTFPGYQALYEIAQSLECNVTRWLPEEENNWRFNPEFLEQNIRPETKLLVINFPHNPTGFLPGHEDFEQIISIAREHSLYLLSDEIYRFLEYDSQNRLPAASDIYDKAVSLLGMSKSFGMPGVRSGWLATKDHNLYDKMATFKDYTTICSSAPSEILSMIALRSKERILGENLNRIKRNLALLDSFFERHYAEFEWVRPDAGTIAFPRLKIKLGSTEFCRRVVDEAGILLLPSTVFDYGDRHFRMGFGRENLPEVLIAFERYLNISGLLLL